MSQASASAKYPNLSKLSDGYFHRSKDDPKFLRVTYRKTADFLENSLTQIVLDKSAGITAIIGIVKSKKLQCSVAALRFPKSQFPDVEKAQQWVAEHFSINKD